MLAIARSNAADINWGRAFAYAAFFVIALMALVEPAFAQGAFGELETKIVGRTEEAFETGRKILYAAAVLALIIGIAPMLWGQVKVKWIVSCLVAAVLFAIVPTIITAFAG